MAQKITYEVGQKLYRACCVEEVRLEPGRVVMAEVCAIGRNGAVKIREWRMGSWCRPNRATWPDWLHAGGWRASEREAIEKGIEYLERITPEQIQHAQDCVTALAALKAKLGTPQQSQEQTREARG